MAKVCALLIALSSIAVGSLSSDSGQPGQALAGAEVMNLLFMADIGHSRDHRDRLTTPSMIMGRCALEGSFSLYEGLADFIMNQGVRPEAVIIAGDVGYVGGDAAGLNDTRGDFQKYLAGHVPADKIYPLIGNHDVNFFGCMTGITCLYGSKQKYFLSAKDLSFDEWHRNWMHSFPGLSDVIIPEAVAEKHSWMAPLRYNLNVKPESSIYFIMGLVSGALVLKWGPGTPEDATDAHAPGGDALECAFLRDSIVHGRKMGKTIFVYVTHDFKQSCSDWSLIRQMDVWIYGHLHTAWQSVQPAAVVVQEQRHFPIRVLIGNGGFDNAMMDSVSFGHLREELLPGAGQSGQDRVRLTFDFYDTCRSPITCPSLTHPVLESKCWTACESVAGGYDGGGGPRSAVPSKQRLGFTFEAPLRPANNTPKAPFGGTWQLFVVRSATSFGWIALGSCGRGPRFARGTCLSVVESQDAAASFAAYDGQQSVGSADVTARLAVVAEGSSEQQGRGPVVAHGNRLAEGPSFWQTDHLGPGKMQPSDGYQFHFSSTADGWLLHGVLLKPPWKGRESILELSAKSALDVSFHAPSSSSAAAVIV